MLLTKFKKSCRYLVAGLSSVALAPVVTLAQVKSAPQVVHLGKSTGGGFFAVVDAGTADGFDAESEVCLFNAKDHLILCSRVLVAKRRASALALTRRQYDKTIPSMTARLSAQNEQIITDQSARDARTASIKSGPEGTGSGSDNRDDNRDNRDNRDSNDRLELAPKHFFRDGRSPEEISRIERALSRAEPPESAESPKSLAQSSLPPGSGVDANTEYKIVPATLKKSADVRRFRVGYNYHLLMPVVFNHLRLNEVAATGELKWSVVKQQKSAPLGADFALQFPSKNRSIVLRVLGGGTEARKTGYKFNAANLSIRDNTTSTSSFFYGGALSGAWSFLRGEGGAVWIGPGISYLRSVVDVSVEADSGGTGVQQKVARGRSTLNIVMPEVSTYYEWTYGYAAVYLGLHTGIPWLAGANKLEANDTDDLVGVGTSQTVNTDNNKNLLQSIQHDRSKFSLATFVAGSMHF